MAGITGIKIVLHIALRVAIMIVVNKGLIRKARREALFKTSGIVNCRTSIDRCQDADKCPVTVDTEDKGTIMGFTVDLGINRPRPMDNIGVMDSKREINVDIREDP
jgi:hypothetical protein